MALVLSLVVGVVELTELVVADLPAVVVLCVFATGLWVVVFAVVCAPAIPAIIKNAAGKMYFFINKF